MTTISKIAKPCGIHVGNMDSVTNRYKCPGCKLLLRDPVQAECGHRYCKSFVTAGSGGAIECTACQEEGEDPVPKLSLDSVTADAAMSRDLNLTEFDCRWSPECKVRKRLPELIQHMESDCDFRQINCDLCEELLTASLLEKHKANECKNRPVKCKKCEENVPESEMQAHLDTECIGSTRQCESCGARVRDTDEARLSHTKTDCPVKWLDNEPCPFGCGVVADAKAHRLECQVLHADRVRIELLGGLGVVSVASGGGAAGTSGQQVVEAYGAASLEPASTSEQPTGEAESPLDYTERIISTGEMIDNLIKFGLPHDAKTTRDTAGQVEFFNRLKFAFNTVPELEKVQREIDQKLGVAYRGVDPLIEQKHREYEELTKACDTYCDLLRAMSLKEVRLGDLDRCISLQELGSTDGVLVWKIAFFRERLSDTEYEPVVFSPILFAEKFGYKLCAVAYLNGHNSGRGSHVSLYCRLLQGPYDAAQRWPFRRTVTFTLLDQTGAAAHLRREYLPEQSSQFQRPSQPLGQLFGYDKFVPKDDLESKGFLKDDILFVRIQVSKPTLNSGDF